MRSVRLSVVVAILGVLCCPASGWAQAVANGVIAGVVKDTSGALMPGVTVEAASPVLIEKIRSVVTDEKGQYKVIALPPGAYAVTFSLPGFSTVKRDGLELSTGFTATIDATLQVGSVEETITVSGAAPVVDTQNVLQQQVLQRATLDSLPNSRTIGSYAVLIPGAVVSGQDVGGTSGNQGAGGNFSIHGGRSGDINLNQDGMNLNAMLAAGNITYSFNHASTQEVSVETSGISAETATGGVVINVVPREGGNRPSGYFSANGSNDHMQSDNLSDALRAAKLIETPKVKKVYDASFAFGGRIVQDRMWFFTAHRWWGGSQEKPGSYVNKSTNPFLYVPDTSHLAATNDFFRDNTARITWQASPRNKINATVDVQSNCSCLFNLLSLNNAPDSLSEHWYTNRVAQASWTSPFNSKLLFEAGFSAAYTGLDNRFGPATSLDSIAITETTTGLQYNAQATNLTPGGAYGKFPSWNVNQRFAMSYVTGSHAFKVGLQSQEAWKDHQNLTIIQGLSYNFTNGRPISLTEWVNPYGVKANLNILGLYAQDQWTVNRLTLNLGVRYDRLNGHDPAQSIPAGARTPAYEFAEVENVPAFNDVNARLGAAYNLFGNGKTAIKGFIGRYVPIESLNGWASLANPVSLIVTTATRTWTDANSNFVPDCDLKNTGAQNLTTSGGDNCGALNDQLFGQQKLNTTYTDDVLHGFGNRPNYNWQANAAFNHELSSGVSLNAAYYRTWYGNFTVTSNDATPAASYDPFCITVPNDSRFPGGGGNQLCGLYDVTPTLFGQVKNTVAQASSYGRQTEVFNGVDLTMTSRFGKGGQLSGGVSTGRTETNNCAVVADNPQVSSALPRTEQFCDSVLPWSGQTQAKFFGVYPLPWGLQASATFQNLPGTPLAATYVATNAQILPSLGRNLAAGANSTSTVTIIAPNTVFLDRRSQLDLRFGWSRKLRGARLSTSFDIYNLNNASDILSFNSRYSGSDGGSWLTPQTIVQGRLFKIGAQLEF